MSSDRPLEGNDVEPAVAVWDHQAPVEGSVLAGLSAAAREDLLARATPVFLRAGEWLFRAGDVADAVFVLRSGRVEVLDERRPAGGGDGLLRVLGPGAALGEIGLLTGTRRSASVRARRDCRLLRIDASVFAALLEGTRGFATALTRAMGIRLANLPTATSDPLPVRVVAVSAVGPVPTPELVTAEMHRVLEHLQPKSRVVLVTPEQAWARARAAGPSEEPSATDAAEEFARLLDRWEEEHDVVLLAAGALTGSTAGSRHWTDFCLRSADRNVVVVGPDDTSTMVRAPSALRAQLPGRPDLCFLDPPRPAHVTGWLDAVPVRGHNLVRTGSPDVAAETVGRMTQRLLGRSLGVVLSGGGARGFCHLGVLAAFRAAGIRIDRVGGCSIGAIVGALFAAGHDDATLLEMARRHLVRGRPLSDYTVPRTALLRGAKMRMALQAAMGPEPIEMLPRPYFCVSADLTQAEPVVHRRGALWQAVLASASIPGLLPPQVVDDRLLVDGGVLNNLPIDVMVEEGEGPVVAVDVMRPFSTRGRGPARRRLLGVQRGGGTEDNVPLPPIAEVLARATVLSSWRSAEQNRARAALTITVPDDGTGLLEWQRLDALVETGRRAAEAALADPTRRLPGR